MLSAIAKMRTELENKQSEKENLFSKIKEVEKTKMDKVAADYVNLHSELESLEHKQGDQATNEKRLTEIKAALKIVEQMIIAQGYEEGLDTAAPIFVPSSHPDVNPVVFAGEEQTQHISN